MLIFKKSKSINSTSINSTIHCLFTRNTLWISTSKSTFTKCFISILILLMMNIYKFFFSMESFTILSKNKYASNNETSIFMCIFLSACLQKKVFIRNVSSFIKKKQMCSNFENMFCCLHFLIELNIHVF